ncbi:hypothetical protein [Mesorhizobium xinjiangense]|uniref:hypothetical protein n=1 Tax=Mesorhizobium xinjiangense TaxID=2678685 RepID=UPI0012EECA37|nr:hypothetical protein [Mesorhizobium xinjiangense]
MDEIGEEMAGEIDGLQKRYEDASSDAAYAQQALEEGRAGGEVSPRIDDLTDTIERYFKRIALLKSEVDFVNRLREDVNAFTDANRIGAAQKPSTDASPR